MDSTPIYTSVTDFYSLPRIRKNLKRYSNKYLRIIKGDSLENRTYQA